MVHRIMQRLFEDVPVRRAALLISVAVVAFIIPIAVLSFSSRARVTVVQTGLAIVGASLPQDDDGFTNVLLLGVGDENHDGADLTDTIILASIDPTHTRSVVMLSLPRDLLVSPTGGRINVLYANAKYRLMAQEKLSEEEASQMAMIEVMERYSSLLDIEIHGVMKADFTAFEQTVDAIGGVTVDVQERIADYSYPIAEGRVGTFIIEEGEQLLDGETALRYARSRHASNDFDRSARQQQLLRAMVANVRSFSRSEQLALASNLQQRLQGHVETTFTVPELLGLVQASVNLSLDRVVTMQVNFSAGSDYSAAEAGGFVYPAPPEQYEGASVLLPVPLPGQKQDWRQIKTFAALLTERRELFLHPRNIKVINVDASAMHVHRLENELVRYGFTLIEDDTEHDDADSLSGSLIMYRGSSSKEHAQFLGDMLTIPVAKEGDVKASGSGDVLLFLGKGFTYQPFQTLTGAVLD